MKSHPPNKQSLIKPKGQNGFAFDVAWRGEFSSERNAGTDEVALWRKSSAESAIT
jgi:hypothetical protein